MMISDEVLVRFLARFLARFPGSLLGSPDVNSDEG